MIPFEDQLYFTDLPPDNTGGVGEVHYEFLALRGACSIGMTPYQEVASGADNEKFAGDYGAGLPPVGSDPPQVTFTKDVDLSETTQGGTLSYTLEVTNTATLPLGLPDIGMPLVFKDSVPAGTSYVGGTASITLGYAPSNPAFLLYSTDNGATWSPTEPVPANTVTDIQWWLADPLPAGGSATADFDLLVDNPYGGSPFVENRGEIGLGGASPMAEDSAVTLILGTYSIGDTVWRDDDADGTVDGGEPGFQDVTVELYWDKNGDGKLDAGDVLVRTAVTTASGTYSFSSLPGGDYLARVDTSDPDLPFGYSPTTDRLAVITDLGGATTSPHNDADFGFVPSVLLTKTLVSPDPALESDLVTFDVAITNNRGLGGGCEVSRWAPTIDTSITSSWTDQNLLVDDADGPNGTYAYAGFGVANPGLGVNGFNFGGESGTIQKVEIHLPLYLSGTLTNDFVEVRFPDDVGTLQTVTVSTATLNNYAPISNAGTLILDVTSLSSWSFAAINDPTFYIEVENEKAQSEDGPELFLDAVGLLVTADQCSGPGAGTLSPVPLVDVYDADLLEFVSASITPTSVTFGATPYANTGTLSWADVGPIATAQTQTVQVVFRALEPPDTNADSEPDPATTTNTATTAGAYYLSGDPANSATDTANVTINPAGSIGDVVFADNGSGTTGNGVQDAGEPGIPGVTVELWSDPNGDGNPGDGVLLESQVTGAAGNYLFDGLVDGNYVVVVLPGTLPGAAFTQSADPDEAGACVTCDDRGGTTINSNNGGPANDDDLTLDFGYMIPNTVYGNVWNDHDGDGVQDAGENGLNNVTVDLLDCGADTVCGNGDDGATRSTTTDSLGDWQISDLPDGNYQAVVNTGTLPAGGSWSQTVDPDATLDDRTTATLILANGALSGTHDFAYEQSGSSSIGDTLYVDWNTDGDQDSGEEGIAGVTVSLYEDQNGDGAIDPAFDALVATTVTAGDGTYSFTGLPAGNWVVLVPSGDPQMPAGALATQDPDETGLCTVCDFKGTVTTDGTTAVNDVDFGFRPSGNAAIGDTVFEDLDRDGILDPLEVGIAGVKVTLYEDTNGNGLIDANDAVVDTTNTDVDGQYNFTGLPAGRFLVDVDQQDIDLPVDGNGDRYVVTSGNDPALVVLTAGQQRLDIDFGFGVGATIGDTVWRDDNRDGLQDAAEPGIANITVNLYQDVNSNGVYDAGTDTLYASGTTDGQGFFEFQGLPVGDYIVAVDLTDPDLPSTTVTGDPDEIGTCTVCDGRYALSIQKGQTVKFADFGVQSPGVVGDAVWLDLDGNGVYDSVSEDGLPNVQIDLLDAGLNVIATTTTDPDGRYNFGQLADGNYTVRLQAATLPANVAQTYDPDEAGTCAVCDAQGSVSILGGNLVDTIDFGYQVGAAVQLAIQKTSAPATTPVLPGDVIPYTIVVTNTGTNPATGVVVSDPMPAGVTYVPGSAMVNGPVEVPGDYRDDFTAPYPGAYNGTDGTLTWTPAWTEISDEGTTTGGDVTVATDLGDLSLRIEKPNNGASRQFDLTGYSTASVALEFRRVGFDDAGDYVALSVSYDGGTSWTELGRFDGSTVSTDTGYVSASYTLPPGSFQDGNPADNVLRLLSSGLASNGSDVFYADAIQVNVTTRQLQNNPGKTPPLIVPASDGYSLLAGETLTVTFQAQVQNPPPAGISQILNRAGTVSNETITPIFDIAIDPLADGGAIGDRVWHDADGDGIQDIGEPGLANVGLSLYDAGPNLVPGGGDDTLIGLAQSDTNGNYLFSGLGPGTYFVDVDAATVPTGLVISAGSSDPSTVRTVTANEQFFDVDFGYTHDDPTAAAIGDYVWSDGDGDGSQDAGEPGIAGVVVNLVNESGTTVDQATTAADGSYLFVGVVPGNYTVEIDAASLATNGALDGYSATTGPQSVGGSVSSPIQVIPGDVYLEADFGYGSAQTYAVSDRVWFDANANGFVDLGEQGIEGVSVNLLDSNVDIVATVLSAADGTFGFDGVPPGSYTLDVADNKIRLLGLTGTSNAALAFQASVLVVDSDVEATNFGYNVPGAIGDTVFSDGDGDGVQDPGEPGIGGVSVQLWRDTDANGVFDSTVDALVTSTVTDASGYYRFESLSGDTYFVSIDDTQPALTGYAGTTVDQETGLNAAGRQIEALLVTSAASFLEADFGYQNAALANISGNVFDDKDRDGLDDGVSEPGIGAVTLELLNGSGVVVATTVSDGSGDYSFVDLPAGNYTVRVTDEGGVLTNSELTSGADALPVSLGASDVTGVDFGYNRNAETASIGDRVWFDANRDGVENGSESGIKDVTLELYRDDGNGIRDGGDTLVATTATSLDGRYLFTGIEAGTYFVDPEESTLPAGFTATAGTGDASGAIALAAGTSYVLADFGYAPTVGSTIGDTIYFDADADGQQDPGEVGIGGVELTITGPGGFSSTVTTAADGSYLVTGVTTSGAYTATVNTATLPSGIDPVPTTSAASISFGITAGIDWLFADFGFRETTAGTTVATLGDLVFVDIDGNGSFDGSDFGLERVTLELRDSSNALVATTTTDTNGVYDFTGLVPGDYTVHITDTAGVLWGLNLSAGSDPTGTISLVAGQDYNDADFGYAPSGGSGAIGDLVWHDINNDGDVDAGESGIEGVTLRLWRDVNQNQVIDPAIDNLLRTQKSGPSGEYFFAGLPTPGDYLVELTDVVEILNGLLKTTGAVNINDNSQANPHPVNLTVTRAPVVLVSDFGFSVSGTPYSISGTTWFDIDGDGSREPPDETGVGSVSVYLYRDLDGDGVLDPTDPTFGVTTSAADGSYSFPNLPDLSDWIVVVDAAGTFLSGGTQTTQTATSGVQPVSINGSNRTDQDFGFTKPVTFALVTSFDAYQAGGGVELEWTTASEDGTLGFWLFRFDQEWVQINDALLLATGSPTGGVYRMVDETVDVGSVAPDGTLVYALLEVEAGGGMVDHGNFEVALKAGRSASALERRADLDAATQSGELDTGQYQALTRPIDDLSRQRVEAMAVERSTMASLQQSNSLRIEGASTGAPTHAMRLLVDRDGVYRLNVDELAAAFGASASDVRQALQRGRFDLEHLGRSIAWWSDGDGLSFWGELDEDDIYSAVSTYWLSPGRGLQARQRSASAGPFTGARVGTATARIEQNVFAGTAASRDPESDFWFWNVIAAGHPTVGSRDYPFDLVGAADVGRAELEIRVFGATDEPTPIDHVAVVAINGIELSRHEWGGVGTAILHVEFSATLLNEFANTLTVTSELPAGAATSVLYMNDFTLSYPRELDVAGDSLEVDLEGGAVRLSGFGERPTVLDVSDSDRPVLLSGVRYQRGSTDFDPGVGRFRIVAFGSSAVRTPGIQAVNDADVLPEDLLDRANRADSVIITPDSLLDGAERLAMFQAARGYSPMIVPLQSIWDTFSGGQQSPPAVRDFLEYAAGAWQEAPRFVTLLGKGSFDYKDYKGTGANPMPPLMVATQKGLYASDSSLLPAAGPSSAVAMSIGRIPVLSNLELDNYLDKLADYEAGLSSAGSERVMLLSDNPDDAGDFGRDANDISALIAGSWNTETLALGASSLASTRVSLFDAFETGLDHLHYIGHGGLDRFAAEGLLTRPDVAALPVSSRLPVVTSMTCSAGRFEVPGLTSLAESLLVAEDAGAVAVWAPSGTSINDAAHELDKAFWRARKAGAATLGEAIRDATNDYRRTGPYPELPAVYNLLGDPSLPLVPAPAGDADVLFGSGFEVGDTAEWGSELGS